MRLLFTLNPAYGHLLPMLPLMTAARSAGHEVIVATGAGFAREVQRHGFPLWVVGPQHLGVDGPHPWADDPDLDDQQRMLAHAVELFATSSAARARDLRLLAERWRPDAVIHELTELAGTEIALTTGAIDVVHGFGTHNPHTESLAAVLWQAFSADLGTPSRVAEFLGALYLDPVPARLQPPGLLPFEQAVSIRPSAGPSYPTDQLPIPLGTLPHDRTIYLTLGTIYNAAEQLTPAIDAVRDLPANVIITTGPGTDPTSFGPLPDHILITDFVPQSLIMNEVAAVVSHTGSGTMLGALAAGVPLVCLPLGADQFDNAAQLERLGAGLVVPVEDRSAETIRAAIDAVLTDPAYAAAARSIQADIAAMPSADDVLADLIDRAYLRAA